MERSSFGGFSPRWVPAQGRTPEVGVGFVWGSACVWQALGSGGSRLQMRGWAGRCSVPASPPRKGSRSPHRWQVLSTASDRRLYQNALSRVLKERSYRRV